MKVYYIVIELCLLLALCTNKNFEKTKADLNLKTIDKNVDSLFNLVSHNINKEAKLLITKSDTVIFSDNANTKTGRPNNLTLFYYNTLKNQFEFDNSQNNIFSIKENYKKYEKNANLNIRKLNSSKFNYSKVPVEVMKYLALDSSTNGNVKASVFHEKYYILRDYSVKSIIIYDPHNKAIRELYIDNFISEVKDFFLYDLDKDNYPEIFIFYTGSVPRTDIYSYTIYSVRKGSVHINFK